jgi:ribosomal protein S18 acetylase RimI-like enzyme
MELREYREQDFNSLIKLYKNKGSYGGNYDPARDNQSKLKLTSESGNLFVVVENEEVIGTFMILDNPHTFWLLRFCADPDRQSYHEICKLMLNKAKSLAKSRGHESIIVYTDENNIKLNERYEDLGFNKGGPYRCYWIESNL